ncbi:hypothetical protein GCM10029964_015850 [Kibdelosporangium lantanae]
MGVHSAGFSTTVFPAANAGAIFHVASISGAFHGVISAHPGRVPRDVVAVAAGVEVGVLGDPVGEEPEVVRHPRHHTAPV